MCNKLWISALLLFICFQSAHSHCLQEINTGVPYKFQCPINGQLENGLELKFKDAIGIQVSRRATHQIISRIFAIFLREIVGYKNITFHEIKFSDRQKTNEVYKLYQTIDSLVTPANRWPVCAIDLEVWLHPNYHALPPLVYPQSLVTETGRFGWFVPSYFRNSTNNGTESPFLLHYSIFQHPGNDHYQTFVIEDSLLNEIKELFGVERDFVPAQCTNRKCVTIFSEYYGDTAFVEDHIKEFNLYTQVLWIGKKFKAAVFWLFEFYQSKEYRPNQKNFIVLHWMPSDITTADITFDTIIMPKCEEINAAQENLCKYEMTPLLKFYAFQFTGAAYAFAAFEDFCMPKDELQQLLIETNEASKNESLPLELVYDQAACNWLRSNEAIYRNWTRKTNIKLTIGGLFTLTKSSAYKDVVAAVLKAVQAVNSNSTILTNFTLTVSVNDGKCRSDVVLKTFMYYNGLSPLLGILGPACSETVEPIAGVSQHTHTTVISYSAEGSSFMDRKKYPYFFRTIGSNRQYEMVYLNLFKRLKWRRAAALTEDGQKYTEYISRMETLLKDNGMELIINKKFPKEIFRDEMKQHLLDLKSRHARIIVADISSENVDLVMCEAYQLKMTPDEGYVWFLPAWMFKYRETTNPNSKINCTNDELQKMADGHFTLAHASFASNESMMEENKTVGEWIQECKDNNITLSEYAGFAYDAVWVYALAAHQLFLRDKMALDELQSPDVARQFSDILWSLDFSGVSGRIRFGEGGSRVNNVNILQWVNKTYYQVGIYKPEVREEDLKIIGGNLELNESQIIWHTKDGIPSDGTLVCRMAILAAFFNTDCENVTLILTSLTCLFLVIMVSLASFVFWKKQYDKKLKESAKVMRNFGIDLLSPSMNLQNTLDKWEVPKERVVINRRLGEGAFGTVYGGEAQFTQDEWTAVAVKTLKMGASTEDRLDFLSEAEAMKRFEHKNIVKLLGVCLQTEPIYTIMEFMLYGDLKTFLLARRHLVNEKVTDDSDISSKRLTMMALDVARGLTYLADKKYVHRDLACRNCLVNARKVVKIGDFGMARPMFENDYYRFNRKGMLPVRWMAPESLGLGLFTPASDVWSFGILLYEIITFGSFPYQGLTNNQVLEYIKNGEVLQIPSATKPHLEGLMKACWNQDHKKRPSASEIVEYISNYPRLLTPCLDVPLSSVEIPETESDQLELLPGLRKRCLTQPSLDILAKVSNINNFDQKSAQSKNDLRIQERKLLKSVNVSLNVQPDSISNDENCINVYSPMEPLLKVNPEVTGSSLSLKRYVPMYSSTRHKTSPVKVIAQADSTIAL